MHQSPKIKSSSNCVRCGRPLKPGQGRLVEGYGVVGPDCYPKVAAYPLYLKAQLGELAFGPITLEMVGDGDSYAYPPEVMALKERAFKNHLELCLTPLPPAHPGEAPRVRVAVRPSKLRGYLLEQALESYGYDAWAEDLRKRAMTI